MWNSTQPRNESFIIIKTVSNTKVNIQKLNIFLSRQKIFWRKFWEFIKFDAPDDDICEASCCPCFNSSQLIKRKSTFFYFFFSLLEQHTKTHEDIPKRLNHLTCDDRLTEMNDFFISVFSCFSIWASNVLRVANEWNPSVAFIASNEENILFYEKSLNTCFALHLDVNFTLGSFYISLFSHFPRSPSWMNIHYQLIWM